MLNGLDKLEEKFGDNKKPSRLEFVYYLFFDNGIDLNRFQELPIPYIISMMKTASYIQEQEEKRMKKARNG